MGYRFSTEDQRQALKTMWRLLTAKIGSLDEIAGYVTRLSKASISKAASCQDDYFAPIDAVLDLELALGDPLVTRALARAQGYRLVPMDAGRPGLDLMAATVGMAALVGDLSRDVLDALKDGKVSAAERERVLADIRAALAHLNEMHDSIATRETDTVLTFSPAGTGDVK